MTLVPRFPNAPQNYSFQNEAQFRGMVRQMLQDSTSPGIGGGSFSLIDNYPGVVGDTLVHNGSDYGATKNFTALMHFEAGISFYDAVDLMAGQGKLFLEDSLTVTGGGASLNSGDVQTNGGTKFGYTDFSEYSVQGSLPTGLTFLGDATPPTMGIGNDVTEGNYAYITPDVNTNMYVILVDAWEAAVAATGSAEMLARVYIDSHTTNRRVGGPGFRIGGTDETDLDAVIGALYQRNASDYESEAQEINTSSGGVVAGGDLQEVESTGVWVWMRLRVDVDGTTPGFDDFYIKTWTGNIAAEPVSWDATSLGTFKGPTVDDKMGWFITTFPAQSVQQRLAFLSFTSDWTVESAPSASTPAPSGIKDLTYRNVEATATDSWFNIKAPAGTLGSFDSEAGIRIMRETNDTNQEALEIFNEEVSGVISTGIRMTKTGTGSYGPFTFSWDADVSLTVLSTDDGGGPLWTFADPIVMQSTLGVTGVLTVTGESHFDDGLSFTTETITTTDTLDGTNHVVFADATSGAFTITLPPAATETGRVYHIKKIDSSANAVTIDGDSAETIDDSTTVELASQYDSVTIVSDGTEWWIV
jgi:hypothetical protein